MSTSIGPSACCSIACNATAWPPPSWRTTRTWRCWPRSAAPPSSRNGSRRTSPPAAPRQPPSPGPSGPVPAPEDSPSALDPSHLPLIERLLTEDPRTPSEYQLANLYLFRAVHRYTVHKAPLPCVTGVTYDGVRHALPLAPLDAAALPAIAAIATCIYPLAEDEARHLATTSALTLSCNPDDSDYLYDATR